MQHTISMMSKALKPEKKPDFSFAQTFEQGVKVRFEEAKVFD